MDRASEYVSKDKPPFPVYIDTWEDNFEQTFRAWPDKFYMIDKEKRILAKSTYGARADALIDVDCVHIIRQIIQDN